MAGHSQSPSDSQFPPSTQHNYRTRTSTGVAPKNVLYDAKYHPMDDVTRPSQARKHKRRQGIALISDSEKEEDEESAITISSSSELALTSDSGSTLESGEIPQQAKQRSCAGYSLRTPPATAPIYRETWHPQDQELGIKRRRPAPRTMKARRTKATSRKKRKFLTETAEVSGVRPRESPRRLDAVIVGRRESPKLLNNALFGTRRWNDLDDDSAVHFDHDGNGNPHASTVRGRSVISDSQQGDEHIIITSDSEESDHEIDSLNRSGSTQPPVRKSPLQATAAQALKLRAIAEKNKTDRRSTQSLPATQSQDDMYTGVSTGGEDGYTYGQHSSSSALPQPWNNRPEIGDANHDNLSIAETLQEDGYMRQTEEDTAFFNPPPNSTQTPVDTPQSLTVTQCSLELIKTPSSAATAALDTTPPTRQNDIERAGLTEPQTGPVKNELQGILTQGQPSDQAKEQPTHEIRYIEPFDVFDLPVGKLYFKHIADSLYKGPAEDFMTSSDSINESVDGTILVSPREQDENGDADNNPLPVILDETNHVGTNLLDEEVQEDDGGQRNDSGFEDGQDERDGSNTVDIFTLLEQSLIEQDRPLPQHVRDEIDRDSRCTSQYLPNRHETQETQSLPQYQPVPILDQHSQLFGPPFINSGSPSDFRAAAFASVEEGLHKRPKQHKRKRHEFRIFEDPYTVQPSLSGLRSRRRSNGIDQENVGFGSDGQADERPSTHSEENVGRSKQVNVSLIQDTGRDPNLSTTFQHHQTAVLHQQSSPAVPCLSGPFPGERAYHSPYPIIRSTRPNPRILRQEKIEPAAVLDSTPLCMSGPGEGRKASQSETCAPIRYKSMEASIGALGDSPPPSSEDQDEDEESTDDDEEL